MAMKTITLKDWMKLAKRDTPDNYRANGPSPGGVASELGLTRQAVHKAIERGDLDAWRVVDDSTGKLRAIIITGKSLERWKQLRAIQNRRKGVQLDMLHGG
jgi:hypothetical protein